jgi:hypothetical protein
LAGSPLATGWLACWLACWLHRSGSLWLIHHSSNLLLVLVLLALVRLLVLALVLLLPLLAANAANVLGLVVGLKVEVHEAALHGIAVVVVDALVAVDGFHGQLQLLPNVVGLIFYYLFIFVVMVSTVRD